MRPASWSSIGDAGDIYLGIAHCRVGCAHGFRIGDVTVEQQRTAPRDRCFEHKPRIERALLKLTLALFENAEILLGGADIVLFKKHDRDSFEVIVDRTVRRGARSANAFEDQPG
jgi:hypothetical protein